MRQLEITPDGSTYFKMLGIDLNSGHDFLVKSNISGTVFDFLIFLDSRGISRQYEGSIAEQITTLLSASGKTYLVICRPLECTTWATLINFILTNKITVSSIVTNLGFVDFTPKKLRISEDVINQAQFAVGENVACATFSTWYEASSDERIELFSLTYSESYKRAIEKLTLFAAIIVINTPIVDQTLVFARKRPTEFYAGLEQAALFNRSLRTIELVELPAFDTVLTYDAVHYTQAGNDLIVERLKQQILDRVIF